MTQIKVNTKITAPKEVKIELVRADLYEMSNTFRTCFEVSLSITMALIGVLLTIDRPTTIHLLFLGIMSIASIIFIILTTTHRKKAHQKNCE